jgi:hypothetical protein
VDETIVGLENEEYFARYPRSSKKRVIRFTTALVNDYLESLNYNREIVNVGEYTGEKVNHKFKTLEDFFTNSKAHEQLYKTFDTNINGKIVTISLKDKYPKNGNSVDKFIVNDCKVTIILPFLVKEHNADEYDEIDNSYTWNLNIDDKKEIYIKFDTCKKVIKSDLEKYLPFIIGGSIIVIILILILVNSNRNNRNKI